MLTLGCESPSASSQNAPSIVEIKSSLEIPMVLLSGGEFTMGSSQNEPDEGPPHQVTVTPFAIDKYEFTQDLLTRLQEPDPSHFKDPRRPVEQIRWSEAAILCNIRSEAEGLEPCYNESTFACNLTRTDTVYRRKLNGNTQLEPETLAIYPADLLRKLIRKPVTPVTPPNKRIRLECVEPTNSSYMTCWEMLPNGAMTSTELTFIKQHRPTIPKAQTRAQSASSVADPGSRVQPPAGHPLVHQIIPELTMPASHVTRLASVASDN